MTAGLAEGRSSGGSLTELRALLELNRGEVANLRAEVTSFREDVNAIIGCLVEAEVLNADEVRRRLRLGRGRSRGMAGTLPMFSDIGADTASPSDKPLYDVDLQVGLLAGPDALRAAGQVSKIAGAASRNAWPAAVRLWSRHLIVVGGTSAQGPSLRSAERFNTDTGAWHFVPELRDARGCASGGTIGQRLYVCGGFVDDDDAGCDDEDNLVLSSSECLDLAGGDAWEACPSMLGRRWGAAAGVLDGCLYVCGGYDGARSSLKSVEVFDPTRNAWREGVPMGQRRARAAATVCEGSLYVCGGFDGSELLRSAESFEPASRRWRPLPPMSVARYIATAATVGGKVYVCGGVGGDGVAMTSAERLDPQSSSWEILPPMSVARYGASAVAATGQLFVFGGNGLKLRLSSVERYDPRTGTWEPLLPMLVRRSGAVAISCIARC